MFFFVMGVLGKSFSFTCEVLFNGSIAMAEINTMMQVVMDVLTFP